MMTFDTGAFSNACKPGAKPREKIEDDEPVVDSITEKVNRAERLSKEKENRRLRQAKAKEDRKRQTMRKKQQEKRTDGGPQTLGKGLRGTSDKKVPRGKVRVNPVTGALETITQDNDDPNYVREGCMRIHKKYMNAAVEAGLGGGNGMYGHIGAIKKELNSSKNSGRRPRDGPRGGSRHAAASSSGRHSGKGSMITTKQTRVGGTTIHSISTKTKDPRRQKLKRNPKFDRRSAGACDLGGNPVQKNMGSRKNNIKTAVGGKPRSVKSTSSRSSTRNEPKSYGQMKGVINTIGGATSNKTQRYQAQKQNNEFNGGGSTVVQSSKPRRQSVTRTLGSGKTTGTSGKKHDGMTDRERRAAFFEKKFGKK